MTGDRSTPRQGRLYPKRYASEMAGVFRIRTAFRALGLLLTIAIVFTACAGEDGSGDPAAARDNEVSPSLPAAEVAESAPFGDLIAAIAFSGDALWVADHRGEGIAELDPDTGELRRSLPIERELIGLSIEDDSLWSLDWKAGSLLLIDDDTGKILDESLIQTEGGDFVAAAGSVWFAGGEGDLIRLDRIGGMIRKRLIARSSGRAADVDAAGDRIWWINHRGVVTTVEVDGRDAPRRFTVPGGSFITFADDLLWVSLQKADAVVAVDPLSGDEAARVELGGEASSMAATEEALFVRVGLDQIARISLGDRQVQGSFKVPIDPYPGGPIVIAGNRLWFAATNVVAWLEV